MALQGNITDFALADILQLIGLQKKTGMLEIQKDADTALIFFEEGQIIYANSSKKGDTEKIGQILLKSGRIAEEQLQAALNEQSASGGKIRIGQVLESLGYIDRDDIRAALQFQVKEILFHLFRWEEGTYRFESKPLTFDKEYHIPLPTEFLLMEAIRMVDEWPFIEKKIPSHHTIFARVLENEEQAHPYLTPEEERVYCAVDGKRDVEGVIEEVQEGEFETCKVLVNLLMSGLIREVGTSRRKEETTPPRVSRVRRILRGGQWALVALGATVLLGSGFPESYFGGKEFAPAARSASEAISLHRLDVTRRNIEIYFIKYGQYPETLDVIISEGLATLRETQEASGTSFRYEREADGRGYRLSLASAP